MNDIIYIIICVVGMILYIIDKYHDEKKKFGYDVY